MGGVQCARISKNLYKGHKTAPKGGKVVQKYFFSHLWSFWVTLVLFWMQFGDFSKKVTQNGKKTKIDQNRPKMAKNDHKWGKMP